MDLYTDGEGFAQFVNNSELLLSLFVFNHMKDEVSNAAIMPEPLNLFCGQFMNDIKKKESAHFVIFLFAVFGVSVSHPLKNINCVVRLYKWVESYFFFFSKNEIFLELKSWSSVGEEK